MNKNIPSLKPTFNRFIAHFLRNDGLSTYRKLEYEELSMLSFSGRILDFGGGAESHYLKIIQSRILNGEYQSANIDNAMRPTYLICPDEELPFGDNEFDTIISLNTLEHIFKLDFTLRELSRILKSNGKFVFAVPFLFRVHGCPDDFNRPTASWWFKSLEVAGFKNIKITPLIWDPLTTGYSISETVGPFKFMRRILIPLFSTIYCTIKFSNAESRYPEAISNSLSNYAMGYIIQGEKI